MPGPIGSILWGNPEQVHAAEDALLRIIAWSENDKTKTALLCRCRQESRIPRTAERESHPVRGRDGDAARRASSRTPASTTATSRVRYALAALIAARGLDAETELVALRDPFEQVRRQATAVLGGAGAGLDEEKRLDVDPGEAERSQRTGALRSGERPTPAATHGHAAAGLSWTSSAIATRTSRSR